MKAYPALDVRSGSSDLLLAIIDDFGPTAVEDRDASVRIFFQTTGDRDLAHRALSARYAVTDIDVSDEDWARRSQENLKPITVGRITIFPDPESRIPGACAIVVVPSMGFGTGHHATTRLCLAALQAIDLRDRVMHSISAPAPACWRWPRSALALHGPPASTAIRTRSGRRATISS